MEWNYDGSLIGCITKDRFMSVQDPRLDSPKVQQIRAHEGTKCQRLNWIGFTQKFLTTGYSIGNTREWAIWDSRILNYPVVRETLDNGQSNFFTYFDDASKIFYVVNKGSSSVNMYYLDEISSNIPQL